MKKFLLSFVTVFATLLLVAQTVTVEFDFPEIIEKNGYIELVYDNCYDVTAPGNPIIPVFQYNILEKQGCVSDGFEVKSIEYYDDVIWGRIIPEAKPQPLSMLSELIDRSENEDIYNSKSAYPESPIKTAETQFLRGHGITSFLIYPAEYYPSDNYTKCIKSITYQNVSKAKKAELACYGDNETIKRIKSIANDCKALESYKNTETKTGDDVDLLLITSETLLPYFQEYLSFKTSQGYYVATETVEEISGNYQGDDLQDAIRNCIKDYYNNHGLNYLILGGDADVATPEHDIVPCRGFYAGGDPFIPSDLYYSNLDGNWNNNGNDLFGENGECDLYAELSVGRICADSPEEIINATNKLMRYQSNPVVDEVEKALLIGEILNEDDVTYGGTYMDELANGTTRHGFTTQSIPENVEIFKLYDRDFIWNATDVYRYYSKVGVHFVNHLGHSNVTYNMKMSNSALTTTNFSNDGISHSYVVHYSQGCYNGSFDNRSENYGGWGSGDCFAETFTTLSTGHVAAIANSRYGWYMPGNTNSSSQFYNRLYVDGVYNQGYYKIGDANRYSKEVFPSWLSGWDGDNYRFVAFETNLFGDPSMEIWTSRPQPIVADMLCAVPNTLDQWKIRCNASNALIALVKNNSIIYRANTDDNGELIIDFQSLNLLSGDTLQVNILSHNMIPLQNTVAVLNLTPVIDFTCSFNDQQGNNDGVLNHGDNVTFVMSAKNVSNVPFPGETVTVTCDKPFVKMNSSSFNVQGLEAGESCNIVGVSAFIDPNTAESCDVSFTFDLGDGVSFTTFARVMAPVLSLEKYTISEKIGNNDGLLQQGETGTIKLFYNNDGLYPLNDVVIEMKKNDIHTEYISSEQHIESIGSGETINCQFDFVVGDCPDGFIIHFMSGLSDAMNIDFNNEICYMIGNSSILLVDLDKNNNSLSKLQDDLYNVIGANVSYVSNMPTQQDLNNSSIVFLSLGVFNDNYVLKENQIQLLTNYLQQGGNLYIESGSLWYFDDNYGLNELFHLEGNPSEESWIHGYTYVTGADGTDFENIQLLYDGDNRKIDCVTPTDGGVQLMVNSPVTFGGAVGYKGDNYNTIGASFEYGGLVDNNKGDKMLYAKQVLGFLGMNLVGPSEINLPSDTTVCKGNSIVLEGGDFVSYLWSTGETTSSIVVEVGLYETASEIVVSLDAVDQAGYIAHKTIVITVTDCLGIDDVETDNVTIYPNPTTGKITVDFVSSNLNADISIYNLSQMMVYHSRIENGSTIDLGNYPSGIYMVKIIDGNKTIIKKIIKQ